MLNSYSNRRRSLKHIALLMCCVLLLSSAVTAHAATDVTRIRTNEQGASLRSDPYKTDYNKIRGVHAYYELDVYDEQNGWYYVYYKGDWGWVASSMVTVIQRSGSGRTTYTRTATPKPSTPRPAGRSGSSGSSGGSFESFTGFPNAYATLNQKMATRTGPGTKYDEPGSFSSSTPVRAMSKVWDSANEIYWIQVQFRYNGAIYCAYTGHWRLNNLDLSSLPTERIVGRCTTRNSIEAFYAPSENAARIARNVPSGVKCDIYALVRGPYSDFIQIEFYDYGISSWRRAWVKDWAVDDYEMYYGF